VRTWAVVQAKEFLVRSGHDSPGGGGGTSRVPWWLGSPCQAPLTVRDLSEIRSLRKASEVMLDHARFPAAQPTMVSAFSLPGVPTCALTQVIVVDRPSLSSWSTVLRMKIAWVCPGPTPV